jgi:ABC-type glycerol-3-phosphate transport system substrate-binding protein
MIRRHLPIPPVRAPLTRRSVLRTLAVTASAGTAAAALASCGSAEVAPQRSGTADLSFWTHDAGYVKFFTAAVPIAEKQSPFTYDLHITRTGSNDLVTKLIAQAVAGTGTPDVAGLEVGAFTRMLRGDIAAELLVGLDERVETVKDDLLTARTAPFSKDDVLYALDSDTPVTVLYYRTDEFARLGIDPEFGSWKEYGKVGTRLAKDEGIALGAFTVNDPVATVQNFDQLLLQRGGALFDKNGLPTIDTPEAEDALALIVDGVQNGYIATVADMYGPAIQSGLKAGKIIALNMPSWYQTYGLEPNVPEQAGKWRITSLPVFENGGHRAGVAGGTGFAALKDEPWTEAAVDLVISAYLDPAQQVKRYKDMGYLPTLRSVYDNDELRTLEDEFFGGQRPFDVFRDVIDDVPSFYQSADLPIMQTVLSGHILRALKGTVSPARALSDATEEFRGQAKG